MRLRVGLLATLLGAAVVTPAAAPAMPYAWVFLGEGLEKPIAIVGWAHSERIMQGFRARTVDADALRDRGSLSAATLTRSDWEALGAELDAEGLEASATYRFYPAGGDSPALLVGTVRTWSLSTDVAAFLASRGVAVVSDRR